MRWQKESYLGVSDLLFSNTVNIEAVSLKVFHGFLRGDEFTTPLLTHHMISHQQINYYFHSILQSSLCA